MNRFWSRRIQSIVPYTPGEQPKDRKFIKLNTNECPEPPSAQVLEAVRAAAAELPRYPDPECGSLRAAIAEREGLDVLGEKVLHVQLSVAPGRDIARLVEVAAMDYHLKDMGIDMAGEFNRRLMSNFQSSEK